MNYIKRGFLILTGGCAAMVLLAALFVFLPASSGAGRFFTLGACAAVAVAGAGGMAALFYMGAGAAKKLVVLEEIVRPLEKGDFAALEKGSGAAARDGRYGGLRAQAAELGRFVSAFRAHAGGNAEIAALLGQDAAAGLLPEAADIAGSFAEIEDAAAQGMAAFEQVESYFSSVNDINRSQSAALKTAGERFEEIAGLETAAVLALEESGRRADALKDAVNAGEEQSRGAYAVIKNTSAGLEKISGVVKTINDISEQTNILSMNAAIESAHAGAAGAGFAVVASEIKKLAESTKINARDIREALLSITRQIADALKASEASSAGFTSIAGEIGGVAEALRAAAEDSRKGGFARGEIAALLKNLDGMAGTIADRTADIAVLKQSFTAALAGIRATATEAAATAGGTGEAARKNREYCERTRSAVWEYLRETEELEAMLFSARAAGAGGEKSGGAAGGLSLRFEKKAGDAGKADAAEKADYAAGTKPAAAKAEPAEVDNSWRKDVTVKKPPRTV